MNDRHSAFGIRHSGYVHRDADNHGSRIECRSVRRAGAKFAFPSNPESRIPNAVRCGFILVVVLVVIAMMAMVAAGVLYHARSEISVSAAGAGRHQARAAAMSGIIYTAAILKKNGQDSSVWMDNPELFRNQFVCEDGNDKWYFTVYAPNGPEYKEPRYGVIDEGGKISINSADEKVIQRLLARQKNGDELADALLDYRDSDSTPRERGAEQDYYDRLGTPYTIKNGPLTTVDELMCVKGFNAQNVYGEDANLNGILDPNENDGDQSFPADDGDGKLNLGLRSLMTPITWESRTVPQDKVDLNRATAKQLADAGLADALAQFILAYRGDGNQFKHPSELLEMKYTLKNDSKDVPAFKKGQEISSGVGSAELPAVMTKLTVRSSALLTGRINVNAAPEEVLNALTDTDGLSAKMVQTRASLTADQKTNTAWLFTEGLLTADQYKQLAPLLTTRSYQFHVFCMGFAYPSGRYCILEAQIDLARVNPRISYLREITRLGMPFATEIEKQRH